jgi:ankyrin repeat protein
MSSQFKGIIVSSKIPTRERRLCAAVRGGNFPATKALLDAGVDARCLCSAALNPACLHGRKDLIELLLSRGADPYDCRSPLCLSTPWWGPAAHWAMRRDARRCRSEIFPLLRRHNPHPPPDALQSALDALASHSRDENFTSPIGNRLIAEAVRQHGAARMLNGIHWRWIDHLMQVHRADSETRGPQGRNALEEAVDSLDANAVRMLLANGADPNGVPLVHAYLSDPDHAQVPEMAWEILHLLTNVAGSSWSVPPDRLADLL